MIVAITKQEPVRCLFLDSDEFPVREERLSDFFIFDFEGLLDTKKAVEKAKERREEILRKGKGPVAQ